MSTFETKDYILQEDLDYIANSFPDINKLKIPLFLLQVQQDLSALML